MENFSLKTTASVQRETFALKTLQVIMGSIFLGLMAQAAIPLPFTPVPISLQTLAVSLLAIALGSKKAPLAVLLYLLQATCGLPVLAGGTVNPLWMVGPRAGYLIGFVLASYLIGRLLEIKKSHPSIIWSFFSISLGELSIVCAGTLWLSTFVGIETAFYMGLFPFLPGSAAKVAIAVCSIKPLDVIKNRL